jgi:CubicO group peptidase (beta-lactamase class C family)
MRIILKSLFLLLIIIFTIHGQDTALKIPIKIDQVIDKSLTVDEVHVYTLDLEANQFLYGKVEQKGIDIVVRIIDPDGKQVEEIDSPTGDRGFEQITFITEKTGTYNFEIHPYDPLALPGHYRIKIELIKPAANTNSGRVDQLFSPWDKTDSPGAAIAIVKDGKVIYKKGYGSANLEYDIPITPSTVFHMASVSKQFTAYAVTALADQKKLSLNDDIRKYLPEVPDFGEKITIRQLIHHTSGLRDQWNLLVMAGWRMDDVITREHILNLVRHQEELNFKPRDEYYYCNTGYTLLAEIVSRVSEKSFAQWTKENIFDPLNMKQSLFYDDHEKIVKNRAYSYNMNENNQFIKSVLSYANVGATSLFTTAEDLGKWAKNFDDPVIGNRQLFKQMEEQGILNNGDTIDYAFGQGIGPYKGLKRISHGGADAGYRTSLVRFPEQKFNVMVLSNLGSFNASGMALRIADIYLADLLQTEEPAEGSEAAPDPVAVDPAILESYTGQYELEPGVVITVTRAGSQLMARRPGENNIELIPLSETTFQIGSFDIKVSFKRDDTGKVDQLTIHEEGEDTIARRLIPYTLMPDQLRVYEGTYFSPELRTQYYLALRDSQLVISHQRNPDFNLVPQSEDTFRGETWHAGSIVFERNEQGQITALRVSNGRVRNLKFIRE